MVEANFTRNKARSATMSMMGWIVTSMEADATEVKYSEPIQSMK